MKNQRIISVVDDMGIAWPLSEYDRLCQHLYGRDYGELDADKQREFLDELEDYLY